LGKQTTNWFYHLYFSYTAPSTIVKMLLAVWFICCLLLLTPFLLLRDYKVHEGMNCHWALTVCQRLLRAFCLYLFALLALLITLWVNTNIPQFYRLGNWGNYTFTKGYSQDSSLVHSSVEAMAWWISEWWKIKQVLFFFS
jgi:hypothetical protein